MTRHSDIDRELTVADHHVILRGPADLADALPYLLGYRPEDSVVLLGLHGPRGRLGGRIRTGIPEDPGSWPAVAEQLASCLVEGGQARGGRPDGAVVYLCRQPADEDGARRTMERLRPLAQLLRTACGAREVPVFEALYVSDTRYWSYCCPSGECCSEEGGELPEAGTSPMAAAAAYAGLRPPGSIRDLERRLAAVTGPAAARQAEAFDVAAAELTPRLLGPAEQRTAVREDTVSLAERLMEGLRRSPVPPREEETAVDAGDDALVSCEDAARLVLGLQDRQARDRAAEWMEGDEAPSALRLWRALSRRCVGAYAGHAAAPLTLAGWVAWSVGDEPAARVALSRALAADPEYVFGRLLYQALNEGISPEPLRRSMRQQRAARGL
ncbi:DUF4192 domain-containing protein [Streptomyces sp. 4N509B]|uniref:DUF4192 domain-containing protein n=1 Tax=Streptomyces sp. 4N509B TaxID=3457413 RepID=UPI003FD45972